MTLYVLMRTKQNCLDSSAASHFHRSRSALLPNLTHVLMRKQTHACSFMCQMLFRKVTKRSIRTVDTDVVVLAMFRKVKPEEMWIALGSGTNLRYIGVHQIASKYLWCSPIVPRTHGVWHSLSICVENINFLMPIKLLWIKIWKWSHRGKWS